MSTLTPQQKKEATVKVFKTIGLVVLCIVFFPIAVLFALMKMQK